MGVSQLQRGLKAASAHRQQQILSSGFRIIVLTSSLHLHLPPPGLAAFIFLFLLQKVNTLHLLTCEVPLPQC